MIASEIKLTKKRPRSSNGSRRGSNGSSQDRARPEAVSEPAQAPPQLASSGLPLDRKAVQTAVDAIPQDRDEELLRNFSEAGLAGDRDAIRRLLVRWMMIGSHYGDPDREKNHPLAKIIGVFKGEEWPEEAMKRIYLQRELDRQ